MSIEKERGKTFKRKIRDSAYLQNSSKLVDLENELKVAGGKDEGKG